MLTINHIESSFINFHQFYIYMKNRTKHCLLQSYRERNTVFIISCQGFQCSHPTVQALSLHKFSGSSLFRCWLSHIHQLSHVQAGNTKTSEACTVRFNEVSCVRVPSAHWNLFVLTFILARRQTEWKNYFKYMKYSIYYIFIS